MSTGTWNGKEYTLSIAGWARCINRSPCFVQRRLAEAREAEMEDPINHVLEEARITRRNKKTPTSPRRYKTASGTAEGVRRSKEERCAQRIAPMLNAFLFKKPIPKLSEDEL